MTLYHIDCRVGYISHHIFKMDALYSVIKYVAL